MEGRIDQATIPRYIQIADDLLDQIESGELAPGDRLPPERALSESSGVSRMTLRAALHTLEQKGLLERRQGAGTFVARSKIERQAGKLVPFTESMQRQGFKTGARIILCEQQPAGSTIAEALEVPLSASVYIIHRLRTINQEPVMFEKFAMPAERFRDLDRHNLEGRSVYEIAETEYGVMASRARQSLEPVAANDYEARLLGIDPGSPLMLERRLAFDQFGRPFENGKDLYRGDRFRFVTEIAPLAM
jgi:GntR family transcriptional regulator